MSHTFHTVNEVGISEIKDFLRANHKTFANREPVESELHAWAADAEFQLGEGNSATIEVGAAHSANGCPVTFTVSDAGLDKHLETED